MFRGNCVCCIEARLSDAGASVTLVESKQTKSSYPWMYLNQGYKLALSPDLPAPLFKCPKEFGSSSFDPDMHGHTVCCTVLIGQLRLRRVSRSSGNYRPDDLWMWPEQRFFTVMMVHSHRMQSGQLVVRRVTVSISGCSRASHFTP